MLVANRKAKEETRMNASDPAAIVQDAGVRLVVLGACYSGKRSVSFRMRIWQGLVMH